MDFQVSSLSAFVFFGGCRADAGRTFTSLAEASAYFLRASAARFWAVAAARRRAVSRAPVWKSTSESGAAVPKSRGQNRHAPSGEAPRKMICALARALRLVGARLSTPLRLLTPQLSLALHRFPLFSSGRGPFARPPPRLFHASRPRPRLRGRRPRPDAGLRLWCRPLSVVGPIPRVAPGLVRPARAAAGVRRELAGPRAWYLINTGLGKGRLRYSGP